MAEARTAAEISKTELAVSEKDNFNAVDITKFIMSFFIIAIHTFSLFFSSEIANTFVSGTLIRTAVPFYFVASGYFFFRDINFDGGKIKKCPENRRKFLKFLKRNVQLYLIWMVIYLIWQIFQWYKLDRLSFSSLKGYVLAVFLRGFSAQFWYVLFMIYAVIILYFLLRLVSYRVIYPILVLVFISAVLYYSYGFAFPESVMATAEKIFAPKIFGFSFHFYMLCFSLALFCAGLIASKIRDGISLKASGFIALVLFILLFTESSTIHRLDESAITSYIFLGLPFALFLFIFLSKVNLREGKMFLKFRKMSTFIYCFHFLPVIIISFFVPDFTDHAYSFFIVSAISLVFALAVVFLSEKKAFKFLKYLY